MFYTNAEFSNEEYHAHKRISKSGVELILRSPAHYWQRYLNTDRPPEKQTEAKLVGTRIHTAILEPSKFDAEYFLLNDAHILEEIGGKRPYATTKYKQWLSDQIALHGDRVALKTDEYEHVRRLQDAVYAHSSARALLLDGEAESTIFFNDADTGAECKCRPDKLDRSNSLIVDLKTTEDASADAFGRSAHKYGYDIQSAFYTDGALACDALDFSPQGFVFIAVEKTPPYAVAVYFAEGEIMALGRLKYMRGLEIYMECKRTGEWPAYGHDIKPLRFPAWAFKRA